MFRQYFERASTSVGTTYTEIFNSEVDLTSLTAETLALNVIDSHYAGFSLLNLGATNAFSLQFWTKPHPNSPWFLEWDSAGATALLTYAATGTPVAGTTPNDSFVRIMALNVNPVTSVTTIAGSTNLFIEVNTRFCSALRLMAKTTASTTTIRTRGNLVCLDNKSYGEEITAYTYAVGAVTSGTTPQWFDCDRAFRTSITANNDTRTNIGVFIPANTWPGQTANFYTSVAATFRFYPEDSFFVYDVGIHSGNNLAAYGQGALLKSSPITVVDYLNGTHGFGVTQYINTAISWATELYAACQVGFVLNCPSGSTAKVYPIVSG